MLAVLGSLWLFFCLISVQGLQGFSLGPQRLALPKNLAVSRPFSKLMLCDSSPSDRSNPSIRATDQNTAAVEAFAAKAVGLLELDVDSFANKFNLEVVKGSSSYFTAFGDGVRIEKFITTQGRDLEAIRLPQPIPGLGPEVVGKSSLYLRSFYSDLAAQVFERMKKVVLIGNPGVSKSHFQYTVLCALLADEKEIASSPTLTAIRAQLKDINVVVRQLGEEELHILFIRERRQYMRYLNVGSLVGIFKELDLTKTLYLFDTGPDEMKYSYPRTVHCQSLSTLSPLEQRYKGYVKQNRALEFYMPLYKEDEMVAIGLDMAKQADFPAELVDMYTESAISERYQILGGVLRTVLPSSAAEYDSTLKRRKRALGESRKSNSRDALLTAIASSSEVEVLSFSNSIAAMDVRMLDEDKYDFKQYYVFLLPEVRSEFREYVDQLSLDEKIAKLIKADKKTAVDITTAVECRLLYQDVIYAHLTKARAKIGLSWMTRKANWEKEDEAATNATEPANATAATTNWESFTLPAFKKYARWNDVSWEDLQPNTLVYASLENYPFADLYYKDSEGNLVVLQVWFGIDSMTKDISASSLRQFLEDKLKVPKDSNIKVKLVLFPPFSKASTCRFVVEEEATIRRLEKKDKKDEDLIAKHRSNLKFLKSTVPYYEVAIPPEDYGPRATKKKNSAR